MLVAEIRTTSQDNSWGGYEVNGIRRGGIQSNGLADKNNYACFSTRLNPGDVATKLAAFGGVVTFTVYPKNDSLAK